MAIIAFQATAAASWRRVRTVTRTSAAAAISSQRAKRLRGRLGGLGLLLQRAVVHAPLGGTAASGASPGAGATLGRAGAIPASRASVACTRRRSCSTQRGQLRRWTSRRRPSRSAPRRRAGRRSGPPPARTSRCPTRGVIVCRSSLRAAASSAPSSCLLDAEHVGHLRPRPVGERHQRQGAYLERLEGGQCRLHLAHGRRRVDGAGGSGGHWSQRRALHEPEHNSPAGLSFGTVNPTRFQDNWRNRGGLRQGRARGHAVGREPPERRLHPGRRGRREPGALRRGTHPGSHRVRLEEGPPGPGQARLPRSRPSSASCSAAAGSRTTTRSSSTATATTGSPPTPTGTSSTTATTT